MRSAKYILLGISLSRILTSPAFAIGPAPLTDAPAVTNVATAPEVGTQLTTGDATLPTSTYVEVMETPTAEEGPIGNDDIVCANTAYGLECTTVSDTDEFLDAQVVDMPVPSTPTTPPVGIATVAVRVVTTVAPPPPPQPTTVVPTVTPTPTPTRTPTPTPTPAQCGDFDKAVTFLNDVRRDVCESNKFPNGFQRWAWQWKVRGLWHVARQDNPARARVIKSPDNLINPDDWKRCANEVLDHKDAFGLSWGNCAEQASTLAAAIFEWTCLWVRVCYLNGHAWTEVSRSGGGPNDGPIDWLDPWDDGAGSGVRPGGQCTNWYRRKADGTWDQG